MSQSVNPKPSTDAPRSPWSTAARWSAIVLVVLLIPIAPFVFFGEELETRIQAWFDSPPSRPVVAAAVAGVLATDVLLPVPSSVVSTIAGAELGIAVGAAMSWLGMTIGSAAGFALAQACGRPLARRFAGAEDLERMERLAAQFGPLIIVLARPLPVLAEASVLLLGATRMPWGRFLGYAAAANGGIALVYAVLGALAAEVNALPLAIAASIALPLAATWLVRRRTKATASSSPNAPGDNSAAS